jgi:hypothetical protein
VEATEGKAVILYFQPLLQRVAVVVVLVAPPLVVLAVEHLHHLQEPPEMKVAILPQKVQAEEAVAL